MALSTGTLLSLQRAGRLGTSGAITLAQRQASTGTTLMASSVRGVQPMIQPPPQQTGPIVSEGLGGLIGGVIIGGLTGGLPGAIAGGVTGLLDGGNPPTPGRFTNCPNGFHAGPNGTCVPNVAVPFMPSIPQSQPVSQVPQAAPGGGTAGPAVMGRFGAALNPDVFGSTRRSCIPGMVLGRDGLCYNTRDLRNTERMWPKPRKPLLTGGDLNAITTASKAARKIQTKTKQLQKMGMIPKPAPRRKQIAAVPHHHHS